MAGSCGRLAVAALAELAVGVVAPPGKPASAGLALTAQPTSDLCEHPVRLPWPRSASSPAAKMTQPDRARAGPGASRFPRPRRVLRAPDRIRASFPGHLRKLSCVGLAERRTAHHVGRVQSGKCPRALARCGAVTSNNGRLPSQPRRRLPLWFKETDNCGNLDGSAPPGWRLPRHWR